MKVRCRAAVQNSMLISIFQIKIVFSASGKQTNPSLTAEIYFVFKNRCNETDGSVCTETLSNISTIHVKAVKLISRYNMKFKFSSVTLGLWLF